MLYLYTVFAIPFAALAWVALYEANEKVQLFFKQWVAVAIVAIFWPAFLVFLVYDLIKTRPWEEKDLDTES